MTSTLFQDLRLLFDERPGFGLDFIILHRLP
jgi:hypothetical protein